MTSCILPQGGLFLPFNGFADDDTTAEVVALKNKLSKHKVSKQQAEHLGMTERPNVSNQTNLYETVQASKERRVKDHSTTVIKKKQKRHLI